MSGIVTLYQAVQSSWASRSVGKALLIVGLAVCIYQALRRWYLKRLVGKKFRGKVVLITGASSGVGEAMARMFHAVGSKVILASRNLQQLSQLKFQLDNEPGVLKIVRHSPKILSLDLTDRDSLASKCEEAIGFYGRIDILINNAGISSRTCVMDTDMAVDREVMEVNFFGTVAVTKGILPSMVEQGGGQVVVISSLQGKMGVPSRSSYSASKHALHGYFDSLRCELVPHRISVSMICPGYVNTKLSLNALMGDGTKSGVTDANTSHGMAPHWAARVILQAIAEERRELILAKPIHHLAVYLRIMFPSILDWILRQRE